MSNLDVNDEIRYRNFMHDEMRAQTQYLKKINSGVQVFVIDLIVNIVLTLLGSCGFS